MTTPSPYRTTDMKTLGFFFCSLVVRMELESWNQEVPHDSSSGMNWIAAGTAVLGRSLMERMKWGMGWDVLSSLTISGGIHPIALS